MRRTFQLTYSALYHLSLHICTPLPSAGVRRADIMVDDKHPNPRGHVILGRGIVAWGLRRVLREELRARADLEGGRDATPLELPKPVSPLATK
jgi:hypothetical protein